LASRVVASVPGWEAVLGWLPGCCLIRQGENLQGSFSRPHALPGFHLDTSNVHRSAVVAVYMIQLILHHPKSDSRKWVTPSEDTPQRHPALHDDFKLWGRIHSVIFSPLCAAFLSLLHGPVSQRFGGRRTRYHGVVLFMIVSYLREPTRHEHRVCSPGRQ